MKNIFRFTLSRILISYLLLLFACEKRDTSEKQEYLVKMMGTDLRLPMGQIQLVAILNGGCDPCIENSVLFLKKLSIDSRYKSLKKIVIFRNEKKLIYLLNNLKVEKIIDQHFILSKYGFELTNNLLFELNENNNIVYWNEMTTQTIEEVKRHYNIK